MSVKYPRFKSKGMPKLATAINMIFDGLELAINRQFVSGPNMLVKSDDGHVHFESTADSGSPATAITNIWDILQAPYVGDGPVPDDWWQQILLRPGYVGGFIPTNMAGDLGLTVSDTNYIYLHVQLSWTGGIFNIIDVEIVIDTEPPPADDATLWPANLYKLLHQVVTSDTAITSDNQFVKSTLGLSFNSIMDCGTRGLSPVWTPET